VDIPAVFLVSLIGAIENPETAGYSYENEGTGEASPNFRAMG
jgi:hypothetical protein